MKKPDSTDTYRTLHPTAEIHILFSMRTICPNWPKWWGHKASLRNPKTTKTAKSIFWLQWIKRETPSTKKANRKLMSSHPLVSTGNWFQDPSPLHRYQNSQILKSLCIKCVQPTYTQLPVHVKSFPDYL